MGQGTLTVVAAVRLASCGRSRRDPCDQKSFNEMACQDAVRSGGYYYGGTWFPMMYRYPYPYYYDSYRTHFSRGERSGSAAGSYARPAARRAWNTADSDRRERAIHREWAIMRRIAATPRPDWQKKVERGRAHVAYGGAAVLE